MPMLKKRLTIAFVTSGDAYDARNVSGAPYYVSRLLQRHCGDVAYIHRLKPTSAITWKYHLLHPLDMYAWIYRIGIMKQRCYKLIGLYYQSQIERSIAISRVIARRIEKQMKAKRYDIIFAERCSVEIAMVRTDIPVIYDSDTVFHSMIDYYPEFTNLAPSTIRQGEYLEKKALDKATLFFATSEWAALSAERHYAVPPGKIRIIPHPPRLDEIPDRRTVVCDKPSDICMLLFIGVNWNRKGGEIAVDTLTELNKTGIKAHLTIVGSRLPRQHAGNLHLTEAGRLDKNKPEDLKRYHDLLMVCHFLISPALADCLAVSLIEAAAYGLPAVAMDSGGVATAVKHNENGILLDPSAGGSEFAEAVRSLWNDRPKYNAMRVRAREIFEKELSEEAWVKKVREAFHSLGL
jgi:glycosyltransferase involved in cell wall biosynthesis